MTKRLRRILFWSIVTIFIIATPIFFAYAAGYFFDFADFKWVRTGSIYLDSVPRNASISINGKKLNKKTPTLIKKLKPGQFLISVSKEGFATWQKSLSVSSYQVVEARDIFMPLVPPLIKPVNDINTKEFNLFEPSPQQKEFTEQYLSTQEEFTTQPVFTENSFYFLKKPGLTLFKKSFTEEPAQQLSFTNLDFCDCSIANPQIIVGPGERIALITPEKDLFLLSGQEFTKVHSDISEIKFSIDGNKLLILSNNEIWVYYFAPTDSQPFHQPADKIFLARFSSPIISAQWYQTNNHILFSNQSQIKMIEIDERDSRNIFDLTPAKNAVLFRASSSGKIYFKSQDQFFELELEE